MSFIRVRFPLPRALVQTCNFLPINLDFRDDRNVIQTRSCVCAVRVCCYRWQISHAADRRVDDNQYYAKRRTDDLSVQDASSANSGNRRQQQCRATATDW